MHAPSAFTQGMAGALSLVAASFAAPLEAVLSLAERVACALRGAVVRRRRFLGRKGIRVSSIPIRELSREWPSFSAFLHEPVGVVTREATFLPAHEHLWRFDSAAMQRPFPSSVLPWEVQQLCLSAADAIRAQLPPSFPAVDLCAWQVNDTPPSRVRSLHYDAPQLGALVATLTVGGSARVLFQENDGTRDTVRQAAGDACVACKHR